MKKKNILTFIIGVAVGGVIGYVVSENNQWNSFVKNITNNDFGECCYDGCCGGNCGETIDKEIEEDFDKQ